MVAEGKRADDEIDARILFERLQRILLGVHGHEVDDLLEHALQHRPRGRLCRDQRAISPTFVITAADEIHFPRQ
jgi:hypothetical protein